MPASNPTSPAPNLFFTEPLQFAHAVGAVVQGDGLTTSGVGFQPPYTTEGKFEALEFAAGNYGLLESATQYAIDVTPPKVVMTGAFVLDLLAERPCSGPADRLDVPVRERAVGDPLHDRRVDAERVVAAVGLHRRP